MPSSDDDDTRHKLMSDLRDDARERGPQFKPVALAYAELAARLSRERLRVAAEALAKQLRGKSCP